MMGLMGLMLDLIIFISHKKKKKTLHLISVFKANFPLDSELEFYSAIKCGRMSLTPAW